jgi:hypothetical protein
MRVLFAIPHYYDPAGNKFYGSLGTDIDRRAAAVRGRRRAPWSPGDSATAD